MTEPLEARRLFSLSTIHAASFNDNIAEIDGNIYFLGQDATHGYELFKSDNTAVGATLVKDINPGPDGTSIGSMLVVDDRLYFTANDGVQWSLWRTDGTQNGTVKVYAGGDNSSGALPSALTAVGDTLYFTSNGSLWKLNANALSATAVAPNLITGLQEPTLTVFDGALFLSSMTFDGQNAQGFTLFRTRLIRTNGTDAGTSVVRDFGANTTPPPTNAISNFTVIGNTLFFEYSNQLWKTQGTPQTTAQLQVDDPNASFDQMWNLGGRLVIAFGTYIETIDPNTGHAQVIRSDLHLFVPGVNHPPVPPVQHGDYAYFTLGQYGETLLETDGTPGGTKPIVSLQPFISGVGNPFVNFVAKVGHFTYFSAHYSYFNNNNFEVGPSLWVVGSDPTAPTFVTTALPQANTTVIDRNRMYFVSIGGNGSSLDYLSPVLCDLSGTISNPFVTSGTKTLANVKVFVDLNDNGALDGGEPVSISDQNGKYSFINLDPGEYTLGLIGPSPTWHFYSNLTLSLTTPTVIVSLNKTTNQPLYAADTLPPIVSGKVFRDLNGNKAPDPGEAKALVVFEDANSNFKLDPGELSTQSDANGNYQLTLSAPGSRTIHLVVPDGWDGGQWTGFSMANASAIPGQNVPLNLPVAIPETVSGVFFDDRNGNGQRESSEPLLANQTILLKTSSQFWLTRIVPTDATGHYSVQLPFISEPNETFDLTAVAPSGRRISTSGSFTEKNPWDSKTVEVDFGSTTLAEISGTVGYLPQKGKPWFNSPAALAGWTVFIDKNQNEKLDKGEIAVKTQSGGTFNFPSMPAGNYTVHLIPHDSTFQISQGASRTFTIGAGGERSLNFSVVKAWSVQGVIYGDSNKNRHYDSNETLFVNTRVFVDANGNGTWDRREISTLTDSKGNYVLSGLTTNQIMIDAVAPAGMRAVEQTIKGAVKATANIALTTQSLVAGSLFDDSFGNGVRSPGDNPPVGNWTVWVDLNNDSTFDSGEPYFNQSSVLSDRRYQFMFENLRAGTYIVRAVVDTSDGQFTTPDNYKVSIKAGQVVNNINFGFYTY